MPNSESLYTQMHNFIESNQWERAEVVVKELIQSTPDSGYLFNRLALCLIKQDRNTETIAAAEQSIALDPDQPHSFYLLAFAQSLNPATIEDAKKNIDNAIVQNPDNPDYWALQCTIALNMDDSVLAKSSSQKGLSLDPENIRCLITKIKCQILNDYKIAPDKIIAEYKKILAIAPDSAVIHGEIANIYLRLMHDKKKAASHLDKALRIDPNFIFAEELITEIHYKNQVLYKLLQLPLIPQKSKIHYVSWIKKHPKLEPTLAIPFITFALLAAFLDVIHVIFFWPLELVLQKLTTDEVKNNAGQVKYYSGFDRLLYRIPFTVRCGFFVILWLAVWFSAYLIVMHFGVSRNVIIFGVIGYFLIFIILEHLKFYPKPLLWLLKQYSRR